MYYRQNKGYIERQIEAIALVMAHILGLKAAGDMPAAQAATEQEFQNIVRLSLPTVLALPESMVTSMFNAATGLDTARTIGAVLLLDEYSQIAAERGMAGSENAALRRAALLLVASMEADESLRTDEWRARLEGLLKRISDPDFVGDVRTEANGLRIEAEEVVWPPPPQL